MLENLLKKIENMNMEEFNSMMERFIERAKMMTHIGKLYRSMDERIKKMKSEEAEIVYDSMRNSGFMFKFHHDNISNINEYNKNKRNSNKRNWKIPPFN